MSTTIKETLAKVETLLGNVVGVTKTMEFTPVEFVAYAHAQIAKAATEPEESSKRRLKSLQLAVQVFKDNYTDNTADSIKVPITWPDTTAMDEKQNQLIDPSKAVSQPDQSAFAQGFVAKVEAIKSMIASLKKESEGDESDEDKKARKAEEDEENEKARKALEAAGLTGAAKRLFKKKKGDGEGEGDDAAGATAAEPPEDAADKKKSLAKSDLSEDGTEWPADMANKQFVEDPKNVSKSLEWGRDAAAK